MYTRSWHIIRDDKKKTFEVVGQDSNSNHFLNTAQAMQKEGLNITGMTMPVTGRHASKESISLTGYTREVGLHDRLMAEYRKLRSKAWEGQEED